MKNWSLSKKIWGVLLLLSFAFVLSSGIGLNELLNSKAMLSEITESLVKRNELTARMLDNQRALMDSTLQLLLRTDAQDLKTISQNFDKQEADQKEAMDKYRAIASQEGVALLDHYTQEYDKFLNAANQAKALGRQDKKAEATAAVFAVDASVDAMRTDIKKMNDLTTSRLKEVSNQADRRAVRAVWTNVAVSVFSILFSLLTAFFVLRALTRTISQIVSNLFDSSAQVSSAAGQIASSSEELSQAATEQAASLEETAASIEEMNSMVAKNSENANSTATTSDQSQKKAEQGKIVVQKMVQSMEEINRSNNTIMDQVNRSNESMAGIVKVIEEIGNKTKVINDIVFQTKLLSFNASVEAARAGEHGKGFAVVAEEVGNLAQMSGNAAKEISTLLDESVHKVNEIVQETKTSVEKLIAEGKETVESGTQVAQQCGEVLEEIVQNVAGVSSMAGEIASASQEQSRGVGEITKAMGQLDQMTQQNAATSEECASAAEELSAQSEALKKAVHLLVATVNGANDVKAQLERDSHATPVRHEIHAKPASAHKPTPSATVVHLKGPKPAHSVLAQPLKKAAGEAPDYDSAGFEEV